MEYKAGAHIGTKLRVIYGSVVYGPRSHMRRTVVERSVVKPPGQVCDAYLLLAFAWSTLHDYKIS